MKHKKIIIAGGSGFIGQAICNYFGANNEIVILGRQTNETLGNAFGENNVDKQLLNNIRYVKWNGVSVEGWAHELNGADLIINLAGKSVNCRYTQKNKQKFLTAGQTVPRQLALPYNKALILPNYGLMPHQLPSIHMQPTYPEMNTLPISLMISPYWFASFGKKLFMTSVLPLQER
jgi:hypothetical protein